MRSIFFICGIHRGYRHLNVRLLSSCLHGLSFLSVSHLSSCLRGLSFLSVSHLSNFHCFGCSNDYRQSNCCCCENRYYCCVCYCRYCV